jgi:hypothetical protein
VNLGTSIQKNVNDYLQKGLEADKSLQWVLEKGHTTRRSTVPGGLGLKLIRDFVSKTKGQFYMVSADGYLNINKNSEVQTSLLDYSFPGTIVTIEFNLTESVDYTRSGEKPKITF